MGWQELLPWVSCGREQLAGHGETLLALGFHFVFHLWVCKSSQSVCLCMWTGQKKRGWVEGGVVWKGSSQPWLCVHNMGRKKETSLWTGSDGKVLILTVFEDSSWLLVLSTEEHHYSFSRLVLWEKPFCEFLWYFSTHCGIHRYEGRWEQSEQAP